MNHNIKQLGDWCVSKVPELNDSRISSFRKFVVPFVVEEILKQKDISRVTHEFWLGMDSDRQKIFFLMNS